MTETKKRRRRPAGFERPAGRRFLCIFVDVDVDVGGVGGRAKIKKEKDSSGRRPLLGRLILI